MSDIDDTLREELSALLDGALPEERAAALRARLESDAALRKEYEELRRTVAAVRALPRASAPPELRARLERKLMAPPAAGVRRLRYRIAVAAVVLVAVGAGVLALRGSGPEPTPVHEVARSQDADAEPGQPARPESPGRAVRELKATEAARAPAEAQEAPPAREEMDDLEGTARDDDRPAPRAEAEGGAAVEDKVRDESMRLAGRGGRGEAGDAAALTAAALLRSAERARVAPETRMPYLFQLNQLSATKVEAHLKEVDAAWGARFEVAATLPSSADLTVVNLDEAKQIFTVLGKFPGTAGRAGAATFVPLGNAGKSPLLTAEVEVTPAQWRSVGTWLQMMNVAEPSRSPVVAEESRRGASKKKSRAAKGMELEKEPAQAPADATAKRKVRIYIRYPRVPAPEAAARERK